MRNKTKILLVEDDEVIGSLTEQFLISKGFEVIRSKDGHHGLSDFKKYNPDLCILDVMLPKKDGFSLARNLREVNEIVPIIFLTSKSQTHDVLHGFKMGGNDYIKKPFNLEELLARIQVLLKFNGKSSVDGTNEYQIGSYLFKYNEHLLLHKKLNKNLSIREAELLKMLCDNMESVVNRSKILKHIWGDDTFHNGRSMDVFISRIRKYLSHDTNVEIVSLRNVGYKMIVGKEHGAN